MEDKIMEKKKMLKVVSSAMALTMLLAGCSSASNNSKGTKAAVEFKTAVDNGGNALSGQQLKIGIACQNLAFMYWSEKKIDSAAVNFEKACNFDMAKSCGYASELFKDEANFFKDLKKLSNLPKKGAI